MPAARPGGGPVMDGKDQRVALLQGQHIGLCGVACTLFGHDELATFKVLARCREQHRALQRKDFRAIEILMQAVVVPFTVAQDERRGSILPGGMAAGEIVSMVSRIVRRQAQPGTPLASDGRESSIKRYPPDGQPFWQRVGKVLIFPSAKTMAGHHDAATVTVAARVIRLRQLSALARSQQARQHRAACAVQAKAHRVPIMSVKASIDSVGEIGGHGRLNSTGQAVSRRCGRWTSCFLRSNSWAGDG